jgi:dipeptidyl-peptidase 4
MIRGTTQLPAVLLTAALGLLLATGAAAASAVTVERLVSLPALAGTPPTQPAWSPDGRTLAFLWNDAGVPFRDLWIVDAGGGTPRRLTTLAPSGTVPAFGEHLAGSTALADLARASRQRQAGGIAEFRWSPRGDRLYFVQQGSVHAIAREGGDVETVEDGAGASQLGFSPDGRFLSFLRDGDLWLRHLDAGHRVRATNIGVPGIGRVAVGAYNAPDREYAGYRWSPDSRYVALEHVDRRNVRRMPVPSYLHPEPILHEVRRGYPGDEDLVQTVDLYEVATGQVHDLPLGEPTRRTLITLEWSPVAPELLVEQDTYDGERRWVSVVSAADRQVRQLVQDFRPRRIYSMFTSAWSSDGRRVYFVGDSEEWYRLYSVPAQGGRPTRLTAGDFDVAGSGFASTTLHVSPTTRELYYVSTEHSPYERHVYRMPERGGRAVRVTQRPGVHEQMAVSPDASRLAVVASDDVTPPELYVVDVRTGAESRVTRSPLPEFERFPRVPARYVTFPSRDGRVLHARIVAPPGLEKGEAYPVLLGNVYSSTVRNQWSSPRPISLLQQWLAHTRGYVSVQVDLRGSVGYGVDFREAFQGDWGGGDLEDLHATVDWLKRQPWADAERIGIWGNSYGGMMALFALFERPGMFAAGIAGSPAVDVHYFTQNDQHLSRRFDP